MKVKINAGFVVCLGAIFLFNSYDYALVFLAASLVHEAGHIAFLLLFQVKKSEIVLGLLGAEIFFDTSRLSYKREFTVYLGGALANLAASCLCLAVLQLGFNIYVIFFFFANLFYAALNLLPVKSLDGGHLVECALSFFLSPFQAYYVSRIVSNVFSLGIITAVIALFTGGCSNFTLAVLGAALLFQCIPAKPRCLSAS